MPMPCQITCAPPPANVKCRNRSLQIGWSSRLLHTAQANAIVAAFLMASQCHCGSSAKHHVREQVKQIAMFGLDHAKDEIYGVIKEVYEVDV